MTPPLTVVERAICERSLRDLVDAANGLDAAMIATPDGFDIAYVAGVRTVDAARFAAMSSAMLGLGSAMAHELSFKACKHVIVEAAEGFLLVSSLPCTRAELVLSALAPASSTLGMALVALRRCATAIGKELDRDGG